MRCRRVRGGGKMAITIIAPCPRHPVSHSVPMTLQYFAIGAAPPSFLPPKTLQAISLACHLTPPRRACRGVEGFGLGRRVRGGREEGGGSPVRRVRLTWDSLGDEAHRMVVDEAKM